MLKKYFNDVTIWIYPHLNILHVTISGYPLPTFFAVQVLLWSLKFLTIKKFWAQHHQLVQLGINFKHLLWDLIKESAGKS